MEEYYFYSGIVYLDGNKIQKFVHGIATAEHMCANTVFDEIIKQLKFDYNIDESKIQLKQFNKV